MASLSSLEDIINLGMSVNTTEVVAVATNSIATEDQVRHLEPAAARRDCHLTYHGVCVRVARRSRMTCGSLSTILI